MQQKYTNLFNSITTCLNKYKTTGPISIIPSEIQFDKKSFIIQQHPFLEINVAGRNIGGSMNQRGAACILYFNKHNLDVIKPMLPNMVTLIENDVPFILSGYKCSKFLLVSTRTINYGYHNTYDPSILISQVAEFWEESDPPLPSDYLEIVNGNIRWYIERKEPIPRDMRPKEPYEMFLL